MCETDCSLFVISQRHFLAVLDDVPTIGHKLLAGLAGRIRELDRAVLRLNSSVLASDGRVYCAPMLDCEFGD